MNGIQGSFHTLMEAPFPTLKQTALLSKFLLLQIPFQTKESPCLAWAFKNVDPLKYLNLNILTQTFW